VRDRGDRSLADHAAHEVVVADVAEHHPDGRRHHGRLPAREIVEDDDIAPHLAREPREVTADKPSSAGDEDRAAIGHACASAFLHSVR
jgi:hypothetical protein